MSFTSGLSDKMRIFDILSTNETVNMMSVQPSAHSKAKRKRKHITAPYKTCCGAILSFLFLVAIICLMVYYG